MQNTNLPAGLIDKNIEFFHHGNNLYANYDGRTLSVYQLPSHIQELILADMEKNPGAKAAAEELATTVKMGIIETFVSCRYGGYDRDPDIKDGKLMETEFFECGSRGQCKFEGKLCSAVKVEHGFLTKREVSILQMIAKGYEDKIIADMLNISHKTINAHKSNISQKTGFKNKVEMAGFVHRKGWI